MPVGGPLRALACCSAAAAVLGCQPAPAVGPRATPSPPREPPPVPLAWQPWPGFALHHFSAELPGEPLEGRDWADTVEGRAELTTWSVTLGPDAYLVVACEYARAPSGEPSGVLEAAAGGFLTQWQGRLLAERGLRDPDLPGLQGVELEVTHDGTDEGSGPVSLRARLYLLGRDLYQLVAASRGEVVTPDADRFLDSFRALARPTTTTPPEPSQPTAVWSRQVQASAGYAALATGEATRTTATVSSDFGMLELQQDAYPEAAGARFLVAYADYPREAVKLGTKRILDEGREGLVASLGARLTDEREVTLSALRGLEMTLEVPGAAGPTQVLARGLLRDARFFLVMALGPPLSSDAARRFVESFELL